MRGDQSCTFEGCEAPTWNGPELCRGHYDQRRRSGCLRPLKLRNQPNDVVLRGCEAEIVLVDRRGHETGRTVIDAADVEAALRYRWSLCRKPNGGYVMGRLLGGGGRGVAHLHRVIMDAPSGMEVDHQDGNGLNNRRSNLRVVTEGENRQNLKIRPNSTSGYRGISWDRSRGNWRAYVTLNGRQHAAGRFGTAEEAAAAAHDLRERLFTNHVTR